MDTRDAVAALAALAQETRLAAFRLLVQAGDGGMAAGEIAQALDVPAPTLSFHLKELANAGLVSSRQEGRNVIYRTAYAAMDELIAYLTDNCCQGGGHCLPKTAAAASSTRSRRKAA
jgi:ArsR family transcriptional regulator, arsenate/arsenite/antimonite-responsive transcriptional repressor